MILVSVHYKYFLKLKLGLVTNHTPKAVVLDQERVIDVVDVVALNVVEARGRTVEEDKEREDEGNVDVDSPKMFTPKIRVYRADGRHDEQYDQRHHRDGQDLLAVVEAWHVALEGEVGKEVESEEGQGVEELVEERRELNREVEAHGRHDLHESEHDLGTLAPLLLLLMRLADRRAPLL